MQQYTEHLHYQATSTVKNSTVPNSNRPKHLCIVLLLDTKSLTSTRVSKLQFVLNSIVIGWCCVIHNEFTPMITISIANTHKLTLEDLLALVGRDSVWC